MRITTQMLNESARKAGLPVNNTSLLNYINNKGEGNSLLDALNKKKETVATATQKSNYRISLQILQAIHIRIIR